MELARAQARTNGTVNRLPNARTPDKPKEADEVSIASYSKVPRIQAIKTRDIFRTLRTFAASTTAHGFYHLNHPVRYFQTGWIVLICAALIGITFHMSMLVVKYRDEPTSTKINPRGSSYVAPDITVCNRMMFAISKIFTKTMVFNATSNTSNFVYGIDPAFQQVFDSVQKVREFLDISVKRYLRLNYGNYEQDSDLLRIEDDGVYNLPNLAIRDTYGVSYLSQFSADPKQMLLSCTYGTLACDYLDFKQFALPTYPACMTFSRQTFLNRRPNISTSNLNELRLILYTDSTHSNKFIADSLQKLPGDWFNMQGTGGVVVFVHQPNTYPTLGNRIEAPVNQETIVDIRYQLYTSKNTRNYRCIDTQTPAQLQYLIIVNQTNQQVRFQSQLADCYVDVTQRILLQLCGFIDPSLPLSVSLSNQPRRGNLTNLLANTSASLLPPTELISFIYQVFKRSNVSLANELPAILDTILDQEICLRQARVTASNDPRNQGCLDYCQAKVYSTSVMPNDWPVSTIDFLQPLVQRWLQSNMYYLNGSSKGSNQSINEDFIHAVNWNLYDAYKDLNGSSVLNADNYLALRFRIADSQGLGMQTEESSAYELPDLFSDIGGILGLYMGISVLTLCEMIELCLHICTMVVMLIHRSRTRPAVVTAVLQMNARKFSVARMAMQSNVGFDLDADEERTAAPVTQLPPRTSRV